MPQKEPHTYRVQSETDKRKWYDVAVFPWEDGFGDATCTCLSYRYYRERCKHIKRAISCYRHGL